MQFFHFRYKNISEGLSGGFLHTQTCIKYLNTTKFSLSLICLLLIFPILSSYWKGKRACKINHKFHRQVSKMGNADS